MKCWVLGSVSFRFHTFRGMVSHIAGTILLMIVALIAVGDVESGAFVQLGPNFEGPVNLTAEPPTNDGPYNPKIASDLDGRLHVIWNDTIDPRGPQDAIFYTTWDGVSWSYPVDVVVAPPGISGMENGSLVTTADGWLAITWYVSSSDAYVSVAPIEEASNAQAWQTTHLGAGRHPRLIVDEQDGTWYVSFNDSQSIRVLASRNQGQTWRDIGLVYTLFDPAKAATNHGLYLAPDGSLHSIWVENSQARQWAGMSIGHARQEVAGQGDFSVREAIRITSADGPSVDSPVMAFAPNGEAHLFWNNGVGTGMGRFHQWSSDFGQSWSPVRNVYSGLSGQTRQAGLVFDSANRLHLISSSAGPVYPDGSRFYPDAIRYATWQDGQWSAEYETLWPEIAPGEFPAAVITRGNQLHFVWSAREGYRAVYYASATLDSPELALPGLPDKVAEIGIHRQAAPTEQPQKILENQDQPEAWSEYSFDTTEPPTGKGTALALGVLLSASFVLVAVVVSRRRLTRRR